MRSRLFIPIVLLLLVACKSKNRIPSGVLSQQKMKAVLWDVMRADQFLADYVLNKDSSLNKINESLKYYEKIFAIHKISQEQFQKSFTFYKDHPALFKVVMDSMTSTAAQAPTEVIPVPVMTPADTQTPTGTIPPDVQLQRPGSTDPPMLSLDTSLRLKKLKTGKVKIEKEKY